MVGNRTKNWVWSFWGADGGEMRNFPALGYMILMLQFRAYPGEHRGGFTGEGSGNAGVLFFCLAKVRSGSTMF